MLIHLPLPAFACQTLYHQGLEKFFSDSLGLQNFNSNPIHLHESSLSTFLIHCLSVKTGDPDNSFNGNEENLVLDIQPGIMIFLNMGSVGQPPPFPVTLCSSLHS